MKKSLKILLLEDNAYDAELIQHLLLREKLNSEFSVAIDKKTYLLAIDQFHPDIILSDHSLPSFNSENALAIARQRFPGIPFIMVTGTVSEEYAANMIKMGVDDYILKDRMSRLPAAIITAIQRRKSEIEKLHTERKIIQSETNLRTIFENTSEGFLLMDNDAVIMAFNNKATEYVFFSKVKEFQIGLSIYDFIEESRKEFVKEIIAKVLNGESIHFERSYEMGNGAIAWIDFSATPVIEAGQVRGICITGRDITEKKIIEDEREFDRSNLKALINNTNDLMWSVDLDLNLITSNEAFDKMVKAMTSKIVSNESGIHARGFSIEQRIRFHKYYERAFSGENFILIEHTGLPGNLWSEISFYPIRDGESIVGAACFSRDITQRKKAEEQLKISEEKYHTIFLKSPLPKWIYDYETLRFLDVNEAAIQNYGYTRNEFLSMTIKDIRLKEDIEPLLNDLNKVHAGPDLRNGQWSHLKKNGEVIIVETTAHSFDYNNRKARMVITNDITEKIKAEEKLQRSESNLNAIIENTDAFIYSLDRDLRYITFNQGLKNNMKDLYGMDIKIGDHVLDFIMKFNPQEADEWKVVYSKALNGEIVKFEKEFNVNDFYIYTSFYIHPIWERNEVVGLSCFVHDITKEKEGELHKQKMTADLTQRNNDLEQFSYIISHNLRAPVANIIGLSFALQRDGLPDNLKKKVMRGLSTSVNKLDETIKDLNNILKVRPGLHEDKQIVNFTKLAHDIRLSLENIIVMEQASITFDFSQVDEMLTIKSFLYSIFYNLISNSLKYSHPNIAALIEVKSEIVNDRVVLFFKDNGLGIDLQKRGKEVFGLYKRFHSDRAEGKGMGLFMVKTQVESIGGKISISSEIDKGTEFKIEF